MNKITKLKIDSETNKTKVIETSKTQQKNEFETNSIDQKAKQFADFFNGEIVDLE